MEEYNLFSEEVQISIIPQIQNNKSLFEKDIKHKEGAVIRILEEHAVGYENKKKADWMLPRVNEILSRYDMRIKDDFELRMLIKKLRGSETYMRVIGSTSAGTWLACNNDEVKANSYMISRIESSIITALKNGIEISLFYEILNKMTKPNMPVDNQTRHQFNTEKELIKRYSDDLNRGVNHGQYN